MLRSRLTVPRNLFKLQTLTSDLNIGFRSKAFQQQRQQRFLSSSTPQPGLKLSDVGVPIGKVAAVALLTYFTAHCIWWKLEIDETKLQQEKDLAALQSRINDMQIAAKAKSQSSSPTESTTDTTSPTQKTSKKWFWQ